MHGLPVPDARMERTVPGMRLLEHHRDQSRHRHYSCFAWKWTRVRRALSARCEGTIWDRL